MTDAFDRIHKGPDCADISTYHGAENGDEEE